MLEGKCTNQYPIIATMVDNSVLTIQLWSSMLEGKCTNHYSRISEVPLIYNSITNHYSIISKVSLISWVKMSVTRASMVDNSVLTIQLSTIMLKGKCTNHYSIVASMVDNRVPTAWFSRQSVVQSSTLAEFFFQQVCLWSPPSLIKWVWN